MSDEAPQGKAADAVRRAWRRFEPWAREQWVGLTLAALAILLVAIALVVVRLKNLPTEAPEQQPGDDVSAVSGDETSGEEQSDAPRAVAPTSAAPPATRGPTARGVDAGAPLSATVKVVFKTVPSRRASVMWGGTRLGFIERNAPLVVERPRDSGPLDVVIRAPGFVPVHARAYTFEDDVLEVRITPNEKKDTIFGFKAPLPPEDAGAPPPL